MHNNFVLDEREAQRQKMKSAQVPQSMHREEAKDMNLTKLSQQNIS